MAEFAVPLDNGVDALCRHMGETPTELYRRKALADPPGRVSVLWYVRRELMKFVGGKQKSGKHSFPGVYALDTCIAAFRDFGTFIRNFDSSYVEHILAITDQNRLSKLCEFQVCVSV